MKKNLKKHLKNIVYYWTGICIWEICLIVLVIFQKLANQMTIGEIYISILMMGYICAIVLSFAYQIFEIWESKAKYLFIFNIFFPFMWIPITVIYTVYEIYSFMRDEKNEE